MQVRDLMIKDVIKVSPETSLKELLKLLFERRIGGVPVVDERNRLMGMISDGDILRFVKPISIKQYNFFLYYIEMDKVHADELIPHQLERPVKDCMKSTHLISLSQEDDFEKLVTVLAEHHFKKVPVLDQDRTVVGIISRGDILRFIVNKWIQE
jgi:CBS domain-containing protein